MTVTGMPQPQNLPHYSKRFKSVLAYDLPSLTAALSDRVYADYVVTHIDVINVAPPAGGYPMEKYFAFLEHKEFVNDTKI